MSNLNDKRMHNICKTYLNVESLWIFWKFKHFFERFLWAQDGQLKELERIFFIFSILFFKEKSKHYISRSKCDIVLKNLQKIQDSCSYSLDLDYSIPIYF